MTMSVEKIVEKIDGNIASITKGGGVITIEDRTAATPITTVGMVTTAATTEITTEAIPRDTMTAGVTSMRTGTTTAMAAGTRMDISWKSAHWGRAISIPLGLVVQMSL
jgi:hypothetical protein